MSRLEGKPPESVFETRTVAGQFWLSATPDRRIGGLIRFKQGESIAIDLFGGLQDRPSVLSGLPHPSVVRGVSVDGELITAFGVTDSSSRLTSFGEISELRACEVLFGAHLDSLEDARFSSACATLTNLAPWAGEGPFSVHAGETPSSPVTAQASFPTGFDVQVPSLGARVVLGGAVRAWTSADEVRLALEPYISVHPAEPRELAWFDQVLGDVRDLVAVCTFSPILLERILVRVAPDVGPHLTIHRAVWFRERPEALSPHRMPIRLRDILPDIEAVLSRWFELTAKARPAIDLYLSVIYRGVHLNVFAFLAMSQAAEAFHRLTAGGSFESPEDYDRHYQAMVSSLPTDLPSALRERLKDTLKYGNELSLRRRLRALFSERGKLAQHVSPDPSGLINEIVRLRNALTHSTEGNVGIADWQRLNRCVRHLQIVLLAHFRGYIGVPEDVLSGRLGDLLGSLRFLEQP